MSGYPDVSRSLELYQRASERIPGWTQLISRRSDQFAHGVSPIYAQRARGARFVDVDENEYIDWVNAVGAVILGMGMVSYLLAGWHARRRLAAGRAQRPARTADVLPLAMGVTTIGVAAFVLGLLFSA